MQVLWILQQTGQKDIAEDSKAAVEKYKGGLDLAKYRKKPVVVEAIQWDGTNLDECEKFVGRHLDLSNDYLIIHTLEGIMYASKLDYIIRGVNGEHYPCKPDIFVKTYETVN